MALPRRRVLQGLLSGSAVLLAGCPILTDSEQARIGTPTDEVEPTATSPEELRNALPECQETPSTDDEYREQAMALSDQLFELLHGHTWFSGAGITSRGYEDIEYIVIVDVHDFDTGEKFLPDEWCSVRIELREAGEITPA